jgi:hypothetical protein
VNERSAEIACLLVEKGADVNAVGGVPRHSDGELTVM